MNILILCDRKSTDENENLLTELQNILAELNHEVSAIVLNHEDLSPCIGSVLEDTPSIADVFGYINSWKDLSTRSQRLRNIKDMAAILNFHAEYKTYDMADIAIKAEQMHLESLDITKAVKKIDHRLSTLDKHLAHVDIVTAHRKIVKKFTSLPRIM